MRPKSTGAKLPPRMVARRRKLASGKIWIGYYYNGRNEDGSRVEIPLGTDLAAAKRKWAELEGAPPPVDSTLMRYAFDRYIRDVLPKKKASTQKENMLCLAQLRPAFDSAPMDALKPTAIATYRDARTAPVRANREIALLSHVFNMAREWGLTHAENPCRGVRKNKEKPRAYYAEADVWDAVYKQAVPELRDAMDLAYLTGQRPADVLKTTKHDIQGDELRIRLTGAGGQRTGLGQLLDELLSREVQAKNGGLVRTEAGAPLTAKMLRDRFDNARADAAAIAKEQGNKSLADRIKQFQFRDIRPKAAVK